MRVSTYNITPDQKAAMIAAMKIGTFTMYSIMFAAERAGVPDERANMVAERMIQRERKAGRIKYLGSGKWERVVYVLANEREPMKAYVVTAYRWGQRNAHSYVVGAYETQAEAEHRAQQHVDYRGGKYACEVTEAGQWAEDGHEDAAQQVAYFESPYYGMCGDAGHFHPADVKKDRHPSPKPFTVRELQNRIGELEREVALLDWLEAHPLKAEVHGGSDDGHTGTFWGIGAASGTLRDAIFDARRAELNK